MEPEDKINESIRSARPKSLSSGSSDCSAAIDDVSRQRLKQVFDVLDDLVGDFDPEIPDDWTDEDTRIEEPLFWCCREVNRVLHPENWGAD